MPNFRGANVPGAPSPGQGTSSLGDLVKADSADPLSQAVRVWLKEDLGGSAGTSRVAPEPNDGSPLRIAEELRI